MEEFQRQVRAAFGLGDDVELDCVFDCRAPGTGEKIKLRGLESYSAAMHCAAVAAGERLAKAVGSGSSSSTSGGAAASGSGAGASAGAAAAGAAAGSASGAAAGPSSAAGVAPHHLPSPTATASASTATFAMAGMSPASAAAHAHARGACLPPGAEDMGVDGCGGPGGADGGAGTPGRRRSLLSGLFRSLASARRVM